MMSSGVYALGFELRNGTMVEVAALAAFSGLLDERFRLPGSC
jgi:hypothetical protein